jgi:hypothetical protein
VQKRDQNDKIWHFLHTFFILKDLAAYLEKLYGTFECRGTPVEKH